MASDGKLWKEEDLERRLELLFFSVALLFFCCLCLCTFSGNWLCLKLGVWWRCVELLGWWCQTLHMCGVECMMLKNKMHLSLQRLPNGRWKLNGQTQFLELLVYVSNKSRGREWDRAGVLFFCRWKSSIVWFIGLFFTRVSSAINFLLDHLIAISIVPTIRKGGSLWWQV